MCTICNPIGDKRSIKEFEVFEFIDKNYDGEVLFKQDFKIGYLEQEPTIDNSKTVQAAVA